jgi:hypothetical protein
MALFSGCADRDDRPEDEPDPALQQATKALNIAQATMLQAGIAISFDDIGDLGKLHTILLDPLEIGELEDTVIQDAIRALYDVLDALGQPVPVAQAPALPNQIEIQVSDGDLLLVHLHLGYLYVLEVVRILTQEGWGPDGTPDTDDDLFFISFPDDIELENIEEVYRFRLTEAGRATFDALDADPNTRPSDYLRQFSSSQRQAILDSLLLLLGVRATVSAVPDVTDIYGDPIVDMTPQFDLIRPICRQDALYHLERALEFGKAIAPDVAEALQELIRIIADRFGVDFLDQVSGWGFEVQNRQRTINRINRLLTN